MESEEIGVLRAKKKLRGRLLKLAKKKGTKLVTLTNEAIEEFLRNNEYTFEDLINILNDIPSLRFSIDIIKKEMQGCPPVSCRQLIETIQGKDVFLFEETFDTIQERIKGIDKTRLFGVYAHFVMKGNAINKINETMKIITTPFKDKGVKFGAVAKNNDHDKILLFIAYNKKENDKNG